MRTSGIIWKVAGIRGFILLSFMNFCRHINHKSISSNHTSKKVCKSRSQVSIFIRSVALASIIIQIATPAVAQRSSARRKVVIVMDTPLYVYYQENQNNGRTNVDEIADTIGGRRSGLTVTRINTSLEWQGEGEVISRNPDLIILHLSAFGSRIQSLETANAEERKILSFLNMVGNSNAKLLVYSRAPLLDRTEGQQEWIRKIERRIPALRNRIRFFNFAGRPKRFRDLEVKRELKAQVRDIVGIQ